MDRRKFIQAAGSIAVIPLIGIEQEPEWSEWSLPIDNFDAPVLTKFTCKGPGFTAIWDRVLTQAEVKAVQADPYAVFMENPSHPLTKGLVEAWVKRKGEGE